MNKADILYNITNLLFIMIGIIGITVHFMQINYLLLIGSCGIICVALWRDVNRSYKINVKKE